MTEPVCKFEQGCHLVVPCDPGCGAARRAAAEREARAAARPPGRQTADTITSDELDALYGELGLAKHLLANVRETCTTALNRAERAERVAQSAARDAEKALTDYLVAEHRAEKAERAANLLAGAHRRAEQAEAVIERVRAECDRIEAAVRDNPTSSDLEGGYLACLRHVRAALAEPTVPTP